MTTPIKPDALDNSKIHHADAIRKHKSDMADYFQALRDIERAAQIKAQAVIAEANRPLNDNEYYELKVKQKQEQDARHAERAAAEKKKELEAIDFAMSSPPIADIMESSEYRFLLSVINFANRGYTLQDNGIHHFSMGLYHASLIAPAAPAKKAAK